MLLWSGERGFNFVVKVQPYVIPRGLYNVWQAIHKKLINKFG